MAQSRLRCGWVFNPPVHVDDPENTIIHIRSSLPGMALEPGDDSDVRSDAGDDGRPRDGVLGALASTMVATAEAQATAARPMPTDAGAAATRGGDEDPVLNNEAAVPIFAAQERPRPGSSRSAKHSGLPAMPRRVPSATASTYRLPCEKEELESFYLTELMVAVGLTAKMGGTAAMEVICVHGANVLIVLEHSVPVVTWTIYADGALMALCSCGSVLGGGRSSTSGVPVEHPELQQAMGHSSTCHHATALLLAYDLLMREVGAHTYDELLLAFPLLLGPIVSEDGDEGRTTEIFTYFVTRAGRQRNVPIYAVGYDGMWTAVVIRPMSNKYKLATCLHLSCQSRPWGCIHAKMVNKMTRAEASSQAALAEMEREDAPPVGPDGFLEQEQEEAPRTAEPAAAERRAAEAHASTVARPLQPRRSRNMFPCSTEVKLCEEYSSAVDLLRGGSECPRLQRTLVESGCLVCGESGRGRDIRSWAADLYTMRGRLIVMVGTWVCPNGHLVEYDGAEDGLFAAGQETLYVRVFLDCVLGVCVIARSTIAAAAEYLASVLRNTGAYADGEYGQTRQKIADAVGEFTETLIIPETAFICRDCNADERMGGRYRCVLGDGQILSVLQQYVKPMLRPGMDAPRVDMPITYACSVRNATVRAVIRHRVRAGASDAVAMTSDEVLKFRDFEEALRGPPPSPPPPPTAEARGMRTSEEQHAAVLWSAATLFTKFFAVKSVGPSMGADSNNFGSNRSRLGADEAGSVVEGATSDGVDVWGAQGGQAPDGGAVPVGAVHEDSLEADEDGLEADVGAVLAALQMESEPTGEEGAEQPDVPPTAEWPTTLASDGGEFLLSEPTCGANAGYEEAVAEVAEDGTAVPEAVQDDADVAGAAHVEAAVIEAAENTAAAAEHVRDNAAVAKRKANYAPAVHADDPWGLPRHEVDEQENGENESGGHPVALEADDPCSPLTQRAVLATIEAVREPTAGREPIIVQVGKIPIKHTDMLRLLPNSWLNDEVINAMTTLMQWRNQRTVAADPSAPRHHFFSTFFFKILMHNRRYSYEKVKRWTRKFDAFACDKLFFPINVRNSHWILVVVEKQAATLSLYDSMGGYHTGVCENLQKWLADEAKVKCRPAQDWTFVVPWCRAQQNADDCGVLTLQNMNFIAMGLELQTMTMSTRYYRRRMAAELLAKCVAGKG